MVKCVLAGPGKVAAVDNEGKIKSESIFRESRRYYLDLKENHRGRFLKVYNTVCFDIHMLDVYWVVENCVRRKNVGLCFTCLRN